MQCKIFAQTISKENLEIVCHEQHCSIQKADSILRNRAYIHFDTLLHDFDTIPEGPNAKFKFKLTNIGNKPLLISSINTGCRCLTASLEPSEPMLVGNKNELIAVYFTNGRWGNFTKVIALESNALNKERIVLTIKGFVDHYVSTPCLPERISR